MVGVPGSIIIANVTHAILSGVLGWDFSPTGLYCGNSKELLNNLCIYDISLNLYRYRIAFNYDKEYKV